MNHWHKLDAALRDLPPIRAAHIRQVADRLQRRNMLMDREHLLCPVLAAAAPMIEPVLEPGEVADLALAFLDRHAAGIAATLYSPAYLIEGPAAMAPWADQFNAVLAGAILDRLAQGRLLAPEPKVWHLRPDRPPEAFGGRSLPADEDEEQTDIAD